ncbi:MAG: cbb3-type cytochrome c oxidase subunit 3 [Magnetococcales bacterium]|nr:cbb3-type cytochrome c oxidase subunit 3 [Magnetococcales bacterium]
MDFDTMISFSKQFSLIWFFLIFVGIVLWAYWPSHKKGFEEEGQRLLEDDPIHENSVPEPKD